MPTRTSEREAAASSPRVLGIETSCDETAAAIVRGGREVLSDIVATQHELHEEYGGVVPEIASRAHVERIVPAIRAAITESGIDAASIDAVAVGHRPGLIGSLLVGTSAAKALAWALGKPIVGVDHVAAHLVGGLLDAAPCELPALGLVVSGGHTSLFLVERLARPRLLGRTIDDAMGEAFDKAAAILELGYPGGPRVDAAARDGDAMAHEFPVARIGTGESPSFDVSFSGLKTALLYAVRGVPSRARAGEPPTYPRSVRELDGRARHDLAASFERAAVATVMRVVERALERWSVPTLLVGGGASANTRLRAELGAVAARRALDLRLPPPRWCIDNAAMIAAFAAHRLAEGEVDSLALTAQPLSAFR